MNVESARNIFNANASLQEKTAVLRKASELNPEFKNPFIIGGTLRDILLEEEPRDCDVVFEGTVANQQGVLEAVYNAELSLGIRNTTNWEIENTFAHGPSRDIVTNTIGLYSNHTDFLTLIMYNGRELHIGDERTLPQIADRVYDQRFLGMLNWIGTRGRTYEQVMAGDALRGMYLTHRLMLHPTEITEDLFRRFDYHYSKLSSEEQEKRRNYWQKKTQDLTGADQILRKYGVTAMKQIHKI